MKICNVTLNKEQCLFDIQYIADISLELTFVISDYEMDCTYYIMEASMSKNDSAWIVPLGPSHVHTVTTSKNFSGFKCKIYNKERLLQVVNLPYSDRARMTLFSSNERDFISASYIDFFHGTLCKDMNFTGAVVDAGANIGFFTLYALNNGANKIYSIEPDDNAFFHLQKNFINNPKVILINKALTTDCLGTIFYHASNSVASSQQNIGNATIASFVETIDIESVLRVEDTINMLKLDIEGSELAVLNNLPNHYFNRINQIFVEFHGYHGISPRDVISRLQSVGFNTEYRNSTENDIAGFIYASK